VSPPAGAGAAAGASAAHARWLPSPRRTGPLAAARVQLDMLVSSSRDTGERYTSGDVQPPPRLVARTAGAAGGRIEAADGRTSEWTAPAPPRPPIHASGAGGCFPAARTLRLAGAAAPPAA